MVIVRRGCKLVREIDRREDERDRDQLKSAVHEADSKASLAMPTIRTCGLRPCVRLKRPVDTMEPNSQTDSKASLAMPTIRTCGLRPCVRLKRPVDTMEPISQTD